MNIEIRKLVPDLSEDYLHFFENIVHEDCYCTCYCSDDHEGKDFHSKDVRRDYAKQYIKDSKIQGYLAYSDNQVVGWCNANRKSDCLKCEGWRHILSSINTTDSASGVKVKSVFCFTIAPDKRRSGIASYLLERVCIDAIEDGFDYIEAYPNREFIDAYYDHMGPIDLYKKFDFEVFDETIEKSIMRKKLK